MLIANEFKGKNSVWYLNRMINLVHTITHIHQICILSGLALILEPMTCQEVSTCRALTASVSLAESDLASGFQGLYSESMPCNGVTAAGLPSLPSQTQASGLHILIAALWPVQPEPSSGWPGQLLLVSLVVVSWCLLGCGSYSGSVLHVLCNLARHLGSAFALCLCCCALILPSSLFCYTWTAHRLALMGTLINYMNRNAWISGKSLSKPVSG